MTESITVVSADAGASHALSGTIEMDDAREVSTRELLRSWLDCYSDSTAKSYADSIGYPYTWNSQDPIQAETPRSINALRRGGTWLNWCLPRGLNPLDAVRDDIMDWIEHIKTLALKKATWAHMTGAVASFYQWCVEEGHLASSPVQFNRKRKGVSTSGEKSPTRSLTPGEVALLQQAADNDPATWCRLRSSALVAILFATGVRVSELLNATVADMAVTQAQRVLRLTLKGNQEHVVQLPAWASARLDQYLSTRGDLERTPALQGDVAASSRPLFTTRNANKLHRSQALRTLKRLAERAGIDQPHTIHPHVARHTWITTARLNGWTTSDIQGYTGHRDQSSIDRYGIHPLTVASQIATSVADAYTVAGVSSMREEHQQ